MCDKAKCDSIESHVDNLDGRVDTVEKRLGQVEHDVSTMRTETKDGFKTVLHSINELAVEFGTRSKTRLSFRATRMLERTGNKSTLYHRQTEKRLLKSSVDLVWKRRGVKCRN